MTQDQVASLLTSNIIGLPEFFEGSAKSPSFLKIYDRSSQEIDENCEAYVFETSDLWNEDISKF